MVIAALVLFIHSGDLCFASGFAAQRIVAAKTVEALPEPLAGYFTSMQDVLLERAVEPSGLWLRDPRFKSRGQWCYVYLDADAESAAQSSRTKAAEAFPTQQVAALDLMRKLNVKRGGELPWALEKLTTELSSAFKSRDRDDIAMHAGHVIALCTFAADPFHVTRNRYGEESGNVSFGRKEMGDPFFAHQDVAQRCGWELVRRYENRYRSKIDVSQFNYPLGQDASQMIFKTLLASLDDRDDFCEADRSILEQMKIGDGAAFEARMDEYYELLDGAQGDATAEMLRRGSRLSVVLIYYAYTQAGSPDLSPTELATPTNLVAGSESGATHAADSDDQAASSGANPDGAIPKGDSAGPQVAAASVMSRVASKNSKVFHLPTCSHVKRISAKNQVEYENHDAALKSGKRPCRACLPDAGG
jgi:hypothetical protein